MFIFVPDCKGAYVWRRLIVGAAFRVRLTTLSPRGDQLGIHGKSHNFRWKIDETADSWLNRCPLVFRNVPFKCLFSFSLVVKGLLALKTSTLREWTHTHLEVDALLLSELVARLLFFWLQWWDAFKNHSWHGLMQTTECLEMNLEFRS